MSVMKRIGAVIQKEVRHIWRDKMSMACLFFLPIVIVGIFGFVLSFDIHQLPMAVWDKSNSRLSDRFLQHVNQSRHFSIAWMIHDPREMQTIFAHDDIRAVLILPSDMEEVLLAERPVSFTLFTDHTDPNVSIAVESGMRELVAEWMLHEFSQTAIQEASIPYMRILYNEALQKESMPVPGLIMIIFMLVSSVMLSITINREKEQGTLRLLLLTPLSMSQLVLGKTVPYFCFSFFHIASVWLISAMVFHIHIAGSPFLFFMLCLLFAMAAMAFGLLLAAWLNSQLEVFVLCWLLFFVPNVFLSGFIFPVQSMSLALQCLAYCLPGTAFMDAYKGIVFRGTGLLENGVSFLALLVQLIVMVGLALCGYLSKFIRK